MDHLILLSSEVRFALLLNDLTLIGNFSTQAALLEPCLANRLTEISSFQVLVIEAGLGVYWFLLLQIGDLIILVQLATKGSSIPSYPILPSIWKQSIRLEFHDHTSSWA